MISRSDEFHSEQPVKNCLLDIFSNFSQRIRLFFTSVLYTLKNKNIYFGICCCVFVMHIHNVGFTKYAKTETKQKHLTTQNVR